MSRETHRIKNFSFLICTYAHLILMQLLKGFSSKCVWGKVTGKVSRMKKIYFVYYRWKFTSQQLRSFLQTTEAKQCPCGIIIKTIECTSSNQKHIKREMKQMETESVNFNLTLIFEGSDSGSHNSNVGFD